MIASLYSASSYFGKGAVITGEINNEKDGRFNKAHTIGWFDERLVKVPRDMSKPLTEKDYTTNYQGENLPIAAAEANLPYKITEAVPKRTRAVDLALAMTKALDQGMLAEKVIDETEVIIGVSRSSYGIDNELDEDSAYDEGTEKYYKSVNGEFVSGFDQIISEKYRKAPLKISLGNDVDAVLCGVVPFAEWAQSGKASGIEKAEIKQNVRRYADMMYGYIATIDEETGKISYPYSKEQLEGACIKLYDILLSARAGFSFDPDPTKDYIYFVREADAALKDKSKDCLERLVDAAAKITIASNESQTQGMQLAAASGVRPLAMAGMVSAILEQRGALIDKDIELTLSTANSFLLEDNELSLINEYSIDNYKDKAVKVKAEHAGTDYNFQTFVELSLAVAGTDQKRTYWFVDEKNPKANSTISSLKYMVKNDSRYSDVRILPIEMKSLIKGQLIAASNVSKDFSFASPVETRKALSQGKIVDASEFDLGTKNAYDASVRSACKKAFEGIRETAIRLRDIQAMKLYGVNLPQDMSIKYDIGNNIIVKKDAVYLLSGHDVLSKVYLDNNGLLKVASSSNAKNRIPGELFEKVNPEVKPWIDYVIDRIVLQDERASRETLVDYQSETLIANYSKELTSDYSVIYDKKKISGYKKSAERKKYGIEKDIKTLDDKIKECQDKIDNFKIEDVEQLNVKKEKMVKELEEKVESIDKDIISTRASLRTIFSEKQNIEEFIIGNSPSEQQAKALQSLDLRERQETSKLRNLKSEKERTIGNLSALKNQMSASDFITATKEKELLRESIVKLTTLRDSLSVCKRSYDGREELKGEIAKINEDITDVSLAKDYDALQRSKNYREHEITTLQESLKSLKLDLLKAENKSKELKGVVSETFQKVSTELKFQQGQLSIIEENLRRSGTLYEKFNKTELSNKLTELTKKRDEMRNVLESKIQSDSDIIVENISSMKGRIEKELTNAVTESAGGVLKRDKAAGNNKAKVEDQAFHNVEDIADKRGQYGDSKDWILPTNMDIMEDQVDLISKLGKTVNALQAQKVVNASFISAQNQILKNLDNVIETAPGLTFLTAAGVAELYEGYGLDGSRAADYSSDYFKPLTPQENEGMSFEEKNRRAILRNFAEKMGIGTILYTTPGGEYFGRAANGKAALNQQDCFGQFTLKEPFDLKTGEVLTDKDSVLYNEALNEMRSERVDIIAKLIKNGKKVMFYCDNAEQVKAIQGCFAKKGYDNEALHGIAVVDSRRNDDKELSIPSECINKTYVPYPNKEKIVAKYLEVHAERARVVKAKEEVSQSTSVGIER